MDRRDQRQQTTSRPDRSITFNHVFCKRAGRSITHRARRNINHGSITSITFYAFPQVDQSRFQSRQSRTDQSRFPGPLYRPGNVRSPAPAS